MKKKAMISQPMRNLPKEHIAAERARAAEVMQQRGYEVVETYFPDDWGTWDGKNKALHFLSRAIECMAQCDAVYFCQGWEDSRGCRVEHLIAQKYGLALFYAE